jgi:hypothetical protein
MGTVPERELVKWPSPWVKQEISVILWIDQNDPLIALSFAPLPSPPNSSKHLTSSMVGASGVFQEDPWSDQFVHQFPPTDLCAAFVGKDIVFRFIVEYSSSRDFAS